MAQTWAQLKAMSDEDLVASYDSVATHSGAGIQFLRDELAGRDAARMTAQVVILTKRIERLTVLNVVLVGVATVVGLATLVATLLR